MQNQIVCSGCRNFLMYPAGATNVCCAVCNAVTTVPPPPPPPGMDMSQLVCGGCRTLLIHTRGATSVRCSCCHTVNLTPASNLAHVNCGSCRTTLMYPHGAPCVKCALCQFITDVNVGNPRLPIPMHRPNELPSSAVLPNSQGRTIVVENPMSVNRNGQLVSNVVVGVTTDRN